MSLEEKIKNTLEDVSGKSLLKKGRKYLINYLKSSEYNKGENAKNFLKFAANFTISYRILGSLPYKMQDSLTKEAGMKRNKMTLYSTLFGIGLGLAKIYSGELFNDVPVAGYAGYALQAYGYYCMLDAFIRLPYTAITKKPLGKLDFEFLYLLMPSRFKHLKQYETEAQDKTIDFTTA
ncbi:hypothetical protein FJZ53_05300 [Candidatus Woesearchaeota archaeon]|nr:hypothetical protein [Candidatus Woesearchaeota archaeon]